MQFTISALTFLLATSASALPTAERRQAGNVDVGGSCDFGDCLPGLQCRGTSPNAKTCTRNFGIGQFCLVDDDCNSKICGLGDNGNQGITAFQCLTSRPQPLEARQAGTVGIGGVCDFGDCLPGLSCRGFDISQPKTCSRNSGTGAFCAVDDDCASGKCGLGDNGSQGATLFQCLV